MRNLIPAQNPKQPRPRVVAKPVVNTRALPLAPASSPAGVPRASCPWFSQVTSGEGASEPAEEEPPAHLWGAAMRPSPAAGMQP